MSAGSSPETYRKAKVRESDRKRKYPNGNRKGKEAKASAHVGAGHDIVVITPMSFAGAGCRQRTIRRRGRCEPGPKGLPSFQPRTTSIQAFPFDFAGPGMAQTKELACHLVAVHPTSQPNWKEVFGKLALSLTQRSYQKAKVSKVSEFRFPFGLAATELRRLVPAGGTREGRGTCGRCPLGHRPLCHR